MATDNTTTATTATGITATVPATATIEEMYERESVK
jgi:hypothetical protein